MLPPSSRLPSPLRGADQASAYVAQHLAHLTLEGTSGAEIEASLSFRGGQEAADSALAEFDVTGYSCKRNEVLPLKRRGASGLSPYIRHGLLTLRQAWDHVEGGPADDVRQFRDELLWQEYARHWYARLGDRTQRPVKHELNSAEKTEPGWNRDMACLETSLEELEEEGWIVNQARMWLASQWTVRSGQPWRDGEDFFFRHLLDGSRAANRLGWQWATGLGSNQAYGFSRWQVEKRAPGLCASCELVSECPIEQWPTNPELTPASIPLTMDLVADLGHVAGPDRSHVFGPAKSVWLTAESLGSHDPALVAKPDLPAVFVFDEPLLKQLMLSAKRLIFLVETLANLSEDRDVEVWSGRPQDVLADREPAVTFAPTPGFARRSAIIRPASIFPYPWLMRPSEGTVASFSSWRRTVS
jgi:deoxyribodipyrimidine photo-lyase